MDEQELIQQERAARKSSIERSLLEEARIQREYQAMLYNVQRDINGFYGKYAKDEGVSFSEAKRRASATDISATMDRIERLCDAGLGDRAMQEVRLLELTMTVNRLENLKANIGLSVIAGYDRLERQYGSMLTGRTADEIERRAHQLGIRQAHLNYDQIVRNPMGQANYLDRLWANQEYFRADIEKALKQAMIGGRSLDDLAKEIQKKFGGAEYQAKRLLRTEVKRVETEAFKELMLENGIKYYKYETLDSNACEVCRHMNGRRYKIENLTAGVNAPPLHPNCRCSTIPWGTGWYKWNKGDAPETLKNQGVELLERAKNSIINNRNIVRNMSNGRRTSPYHVLTEEEIESIYRDADSIGVPRDVLRMNEGARTGFVDLIGVINIRGDILPDTASTYNRDNLSQRAVLAHEYYGHYKSHPSKFEIGDWRDEFHASYRAAIDTPDLTDEERRSLMLDAYERAMEAGVSVKHNREARRIIHGYEERE